MQNAAIYVSDQSNNKIKMAELSSGLYKTVTIGSNVDQSGNLQLAGLTIHQYKLYACVTGAIVMYTLSTNCIPGIFNQDVVFG